MSTWDVEVKSDLDCISFGKHKGKPFTQIPRDYLEWAVWNADRLQPHERAEMERILGLLPGSTKPPPGKPSEVKPPEDTPAEEKTLINQLKKGWAKDQARLKELENEIKALRSDLTMAKRASTQAPLTDSQAITRIIRQWFGAMSRRFHPDMGGDPASQAIVNQCYSDLKTRLEEVCPPSRNGKQDRSKPPW